MDSILASSSRVRPTHALCPFGLAIVVVASQRAGLGYSFQELGDSPQHGPTEDPVNN